MAMPKKGSRKINIDDRIYLWKVITDDGYHLVGFPFLGHLQIRQIIII